MAKGHLSKELDTLLLKAIAKGCRVTESDNKIRIYPPKHISNQFYIAHRTPTALHPVRRFLQNVCKFEI